jgi:hypothetical protein
VAVPWTRASLETHVTVLAARYDGQELVDAIASFAATLNEEEVALLQDILLALAGSDAARRRIFGAGTARRRL